MHALKIQKYDYTIQYVPGKDMVFADMLSHFPSCSNNSPIVFHHNIQTINFNSECLNIIRGATERDPIHSTLYRRLTLNGWPETKRTVLHIACHFWDIWDLLTIEDGVLMKGNRICIPQELHNRTLYDLHNGHLGVEKMTHLARSTMYWQGIDADIADYVRHCTTCAKHKALQTVQPKLPCDIPDGPWQEIAADYFTHSNKNYLLIADTLSKHPFLHVVHSKTSNRIIQYLQDFCSQFGTPTHFYSDNGPPFSSEPFSSFLTSLSREHITSSPLYPKSYRFIERQIKTLKTSLTTTKPTCTSINHVLQTLHSTPIGPNLPSPHEILLNHTNYRTGKPLTPVDLEQIRDYLITKKSQQKVHYDKRHGAQQLDDLEPRTRCFISQSSQPDLILRRYCDRSGSNTKVILHRSPRSQVQAQQATHLPNQYTYRFTHFKTIHRYNTTNTHDSSHFQDHLSLQDHHFQLKSQNSS